MNATCRRVTSTYLTYRIGDLSTAHQGFGLWSRKHFDLSLFPYNQPTLLLVFIYFFETATAGYVNSHPRPHLHLHTYSSVSLSLSFSYSLPHTHTHTHIVESFVSTIFRSSHTSRKQPTTSEISPLSIFAYTPPSALPPSLSRHSQRTIEQGELEADIQKPLHITRNTLSSRIAIA